MRWRRGCFRVATATKESRQRDRKPLEDGFGNGLHKVSYATWIQA